MYACNNNMRGTIKEYSINHTFQAYSRLIKVVVVVAAAAVVVRLRLT